MQLRTAFLIIIEYFTISFLIRDLTDLAETVIVVSDCSAIGICRAGDVPGIIIGIPLHPAFRGVNFSDPPPVIQYESGLIPVAVANTGDVSLGVVGECLSRLFLFRLLRSAIDSKRLSGQVIGIHQVYGTAFPYGLQSSF